MLRRVVTGAVVTAALHALPAQAEPPAAAPPPPGSGAAPPARPAEATGDQEAARLFHEAETRYADGDVPGALQSMQEAYSRSGRHELLFNLGELERELGHCLAARRAYVAYVDRVPDGRRRTEAARKETELREHCPDSAPPPVAPSNAAEEARPGYWTPANIAGWATIGAGVVAAATGTFFAVQASRDEQKLESRMNADAAFTQSDKQLEHDGERSAAWARGLFAGAGVLVAAGVTVLVLQPGSTKPANTLAVSLDTRSAAAVWSGSF